MQGPKPNRVPAMSGLNSRVVADMVCNGDAQSVPIGVDHAEFVVVRHSEMDWNADGRFQVIKDPGLQERHFGDLQGLQPHVAASVFPEAKAFQLQKTDQEIPVRFELSMHKDRSTSPDILARAICTLDEGSRALAADACDLTPGNSSSNAVKLDKLRDKLERFLYLSSGGIPVVMDDQPILSQFKSLMGEFSEDDFGDLPLQLGLKLRDLCARFSTIFNDYRHNYNQLIATNPEENPFESSYQVKEAEQQVKNNQQCLQALMNEKANLEREKITLEEQKMEIERKLDEVHRKQESNFDGMARSVDQLDESVAILKETKAKDYAHQKKLWSERGCIRNKYSDENLRLERLMNCIHHDVKSFLYPGSSK